MCSWKTINFEQTLTIDSFALTVWIMKLPPTFQHVEKYFGVGGEGHQFS